MKNLLMRLCALPLLLAGPAVAATPETGDAFGFSFTQLHSSKPLPLAEFKGKVLLVVNTASECGFTPQYGELETLYKTYKDRGLVIVGVPSNDFGGQEPGSSAEIEQVCRFNYGVSFPMANKEVVTGDAAHPFYQWVHRKLGFGSAPKWNFHKYVIGRDGQPVAFYLSTTKPLSKTLTKAIEAELSKEPRT